MMRKSFVGVVSLCLLVGALAWGEVGVQSRKRGEGEWKEYSTRRLEDLEGFRPGVVPLTKYGGRADQKEKGTGFFRVQKIGTRWWMIDPEGGRFIHVGVASVSPGKSAAVKKAFQEKFGGEEKWAEATAELLHANGFNGCGAWSNVDELMKTPRPVASCVIINLASGFGYKLKLAHQASGHSGFVDDCIPVLHPDFPAYCQKQCEKLAQYKDNPWVVGYFSDNELPSPRDLLGRMLKLDAGNPDLAVMRKAAREWIEKRKGKSEVLTREITAEDRAAFSEYVYETYFRITTAAIRKVDANHMYLGSRFHGGDRVNAAMWKAAGRYLDVVSMNYYGVWGPNPEDMQNWDRWGGRPVMITEFYVKGDDSGMKNITGAGWTVKTQEDRGLFYQHYAMGLLQSGTCVGWHWFKYMDNDPADLSTDPSNRDSNKGIVNIRFETYGPLMERMKAFNSNMYGVVDYFDSRK